MATWQLIEALEQLRREFNAIAPNRDKRSDGAVGDPAHAASSSDHNPDETGNVPIRDADRDNEVHAIDVDADLRDPGGVDMEQVVQFLLRRLRSGAETRLRYIIFNRRIWSASTSPAWRQKPYTGASPHTEHAHFSGSYVSAREASTASWHLGDLVALSDEDKKWFTDQIAKVDEAVRATARNSPEFLSDTEKSEIVDRVLKGVQSMLPVITPPPAPADPSGS